VLDFSLQCWQRPELVGPCCCGAVPLCWLHAVSSASWLKRPGGWSRTRRWVGCLASRAPLDLTEGRLWLCAVWVVWEEDVDGLPGGLQPPSPAAQLGQLMVGVSSCRWWVERAMHIRRSVQQHITAGGGVRQGRAAVAVVPRRFLVRVMMVLGDDGVK
jgi:hypothetical protein